MSEKAACPRCDAYLSVIYYDLIARRTGATVDEVRRAGRESCAPRPKQGGGAKKGKR